jgi:hypothetical protein
MLSGAQRPGRVFQQLKHEARAVSAERATATAALATT